MIISSAIFTILASFLLTLVYWKVNKAYILLMVFILAVSTFTISHQLTFYQGNPFWTAVLFNNFAPLYYLAGPFLFFYVKATLDDKIAIDIKNWRTLFHFFPAFLSLIGIIPYLFTPFSYKLNLVSQVLADPNLFKTVHVNWLMPTWINSVLRPLLLLIYSLYSISLIDIYNKQRRESATPIFQQKLALRWLYSLLTITSLIGALYLVVVAWYFNSIDVRAVENEIKKLAMVVGILVMLIPVMLMIFPQLALGIPRLPAQNNIPQQDLSREIPSPGMHVEKVQTENMAGAAIQVLAPPLLEIAVEEDPFQKKAELILSFIEENKPYLDPEFNIDTLARDMNIPRSHIYYCFSNVISEKFTTLRTRLRIEYAQKLLLGPERESLSFEGIAAMAGFSSRTRFFVSFKEITGHTPKEFVDQHK
jgi:AraC-like DNA-binding protein